jgi:co-chaperonin GroES (HSP10)
VIGGPKVDGARISNTSNAYVSAEEKIRPLRDQIVLEPLEWNPSDIIRVAQVGKPVRGRVVAVGPGRYPLKYNGPKGKRTKSWLGKNFIPTEVKIGDVVQLGGLQLGEGQFRGYAFQTFIWGTKEYLICREGDVAGIDEH